MLCCWYWWMNARSNEWLSELQCRSAQRAQHRPPPNASIIDNPVNPDFGLRTPGSGRWSGSSPKFNPLVPGPCPTPPRNFVKIRSQLFQLSDGQTDRQTDRSENITSFGGGNDWMSEWMNHGCDDDICSGEGQQQSTAAEADVTQSCILLGTWYELYHRSSLYTQ